MRPKAIWAGLTWHTHQHYHCQFSHFPQLSSAKR